MMYDYPKMANPRIYIVYFVSKVLNRVIANEMKVATARYHGSCKCNVQLCKRSDKFFFFSLSGDELAVSHADGNIHICGPSQGVTRMDRDDDDQPI